MIDVPLNALTLNSRPDALTLYTFNTGIAQHHFCARCGIHPFHQLRSEPDKFGINAVCLDGVSRYGFAKLPVHDGQHHPNDSGDAQGMAGTITYRKVSPSSG